MMKVYFLNDYKIIHNTYYSMTSQYGGPWPLISSGNYTTVVTLCLLALGFSNSLHLWLQILHIWNYIIITNIWLNTHPACGAIFWKSTETIWWGGSIRRQRLDWTATSAAMRPWLSWRKRLRAWGCQLQGRQSWERLWGGLNSKLNSSQEKRSGWRRRR